MMIDGVALLQIVFENADVMLQGVFEGTIISGDWR